MTNQNTKVYTEQKGKVITHDRDFKLVMAIALDPSSEYKKGLIRCIASRTGNIKVSGYVDRSELHILNSKSQIEFEIGEKLFLENANEIIKQLEGDDKDFIGLEDPDIFIDKETNLMHVYFTMPFLSKGQRHKFTEIHLGHAEGKDLSNLKMTMPVIQSNKRTHIGAKELSIAPINKRGFRYNLVESCIVERDFAYSTVRVVIAKDMSKNWKFGKTVFHPKEHDIPWIAGHASPGPLLPKSFVDVGKGKLLGIMNGREANKKVSGHTHYGYFKVGLFIYDYEKGNIDWVSPEPIIHDSEAKSVTFASQFVLNSQNTGILYAHVDDSFARAYTLYADGIKTLLP